MSPLSKPGHVHALQISRCTICRAAAQRMLNAYNRKRFFSRAGSACHSKSAIKIISYNDEELKR